MLGATPSYTRVGLLRRGAHEATRVGYGYARRATASNT